jgi:hypothetical protein
MKCATCGNEPAAKYLHVRLLDKEHGPYDPCLPEVRTPLQHIRLLSRMRLVGNIPEDGREIALEMPGLRALACPACRHLPELPAGSDLPLACRPLHRRSAAIHCRGSAVLDDDNGRIVAAGDCVLPAGHCRHGGGSGLGRSGVQHRLVPTGVFPE